MTPTTAQRPVLKIHMASDARPTTLPGDVPSKQKSVNGWWRVCVIHTWKLKDVSLTAGGGEAFIHEYVLYRARHAQSFGNVDLQVTGDVVQMGVWKLHGLRSHRAFGGLGGVVDEPVNSGFRKATGGVTVEAGLVSLTCRLLPPQQWPAETGCKQPQADFFNVWLEHHITNKTWYEKMLTSRAPLVCVKFCLLYTDLLSWDTPCTVHHFDSLPGW